MKKFISYIFIIVGLFFGSCEKMIDLKPESSLTYNSFWESEDGAKAAQVALHANLRSYYSALWNEGELRSDIWGGVTIETPTDLEIIGQDISVDKVPAFSVNWSNFYAYLHVINDVIKNAPNVKFANTNNKNFLLGQAYGLRAFIYYTMLKTWGDVPLVLEPTVEIDFSDLYIARNPATEVMSQIKKDIQTSLDNFNGVNTFLNNSRVYWSRAASLVLKGDVFIWSGTKMGGGSSDYTIAKQALQDLINTNNFQLLPNYADIFSYTNKNNKEIIFALSYAIDQATNIYSQFTARKSDISTFYQRSGQNTSALVVNGGNRYGPSVELLAKWSDFNDKRNEATLMRLYQFNNATGYKCSMLRKFWGTVSAGSQVMVDDLPIYRYADAILLMAEAKNLLGEDPSPEINQIRQRAYGTNFPGHSYTNGTKVTNIEAILDERLFEFVGEGKRWWDLRRAGDSWVFKFNKFLDPATDTYMLLLPITREMIGRNPLLNQTTGYQY